MVLDKPKHFGQVDIYEKIIKRYCFPRGHMFKSHRSRTFQTLELMADLFI